jgi:hypothetical protein
VTTIKIKGNRKIVSPGIGDLLKSTWRIVLSQLIDFTSSNGELSDPTSNHYLSTNKLNPYQQAMHGSGSILKSYANSNTFSVSGFGAIPASEQYTSYFFYLNGGKCRKVNGTNGVLKTYQDELNGGFYYLA